MSLTHKDLTSLGCDLAAQGRPQKAALVWAVAEELERLRFYEQLWRDGIPADALKKYRISPKSP